MRWFTLLAFGALFYVTESVFVTRGDTLYFIGKQKMTWHAAINACYAKKGHLVTVDDSNEWSFVVAAAKKNGVSNFWIGYNDIKREGKWTWHTGSKSTFTAWSRHEPNNQGNEDCGMEWNRGHWNDGHCHSKQTFVCEIGPVANYRNARYFFSRNKESWDVAAQKCRSKGARLTSAHNMAEWNFIMNEAKARQLTNFWIGLNDKKKEGTFVWSDNTKVILKRWKGVEPNNANGNEDCTHAWSSGYWNDNNCAIKLAYVCEFIPNEKGGYYYIGTATKSWLNAKIHCALLKGNLADVMNQKENRNLNKELSRRSVKAAWIGLNDRSREGSYTWASGSKTCYTDWCANEPNNLHNEDCTQIRWGDNGCWNDNRCTSKYPFVCEFER